MSFGEVRSATASRARIGTVRLFAFMGEAMPVTTTTKLLGFRVAMADLTGAKLNQETMLMPAPTRVEYPNVELGDIVETADGRVVTQVTNRDPRRRAWIWANMGPEVVTYERTYTWLQQLTARTRMARNLSPYIYVYDGVTGLLNVNRQVQLAVSAMTGNTLTVALPGTVGPTQLKNSVVEVLPGTTSFPYERRSVQSATSSSLTLLDPLSGPIGTGNILLSWSEPAWWKVRVLDTTRELRGEGGSVRYSNTRFTFVIDEEIPN